MCFLRLLLLLDSNLFISPLGVAPDVIEIPEHNSPIFVTRRGCNVTPLFSGVNKQVGDLVAPRNQFLWLL